MHSTRFTEATSGLAVVAAALGGVAPFLVLGRTTFSASILGVGVLATVFAGYNLLAVRRSGRPRLAAALLATLFGVWMLVAPLAYGVEGVAVGAVQTFGLVLAAFAGYATVEAMELIARGEPSVVGPASESQD